MSDIQTENERGELTLKLIILAVGLFMMIGLVVDGSGKMNAGIEAQQLAASAARAAANSLSGDAVGSGGRALDGSKARRVAESMVSTGGATGVVSVSGDTVTVTATKKYRTVFLTMFAKTLNGKGTASARAISE